MKPDITSRIDIEKLIIYFYEKVKLDESIGFIFTDVVDMNWEKHIPLIVDFWETIILDNHVYKKNAMEIHYDVNKKIPLQSIHFDSWIKLFTSTVDDLFRGEKADLAKIRAKSIAQLMFFKMNNINKGL